MREQVLRDLLGELVDLGVELGLRGHKRASNVPNGLVSNQPPDEDESNSPVHVAASSERVEQPSDSDVLLGGPDVGSYTQSYASSTHFGGSLFIVCGSGASPRR